MQFDVHGFGQSLPRGNVGLGENIAYEWAIDGIDSDADWRMEVNVTPPLFSPASSEFRGTGPTVDIARFQAKRTGDATIRFLATCRGDAQIGQLYVTVTGDH